MIVKGQKINDRYQILRMIGEGGMANVYLAHDVILDRDVAVKVLRGDLAEKPSLHLHYLIPILLKCMMWEKMMEPILL